MCIWQESNLSQRLHRLFPNFKYTELDSKTDLFNRKEFKEQVLLSTAESGSAWTLINPKFVVITPFANTQRDP